MAGTPNQNFFLTGVQLNAMKIMLDKARIELAARVINCAAEPTQFVELNGYNWDTLAIADPKIKELSAALKVLEDMRTENGREV